MKSLRKSLNAHKEPHITSPLPPLSKPHNAVQPPKKVIRALASHRASAPQELSFEKGDFFHVLADRGGQWYEAHNPVSGARGLVPCDMFEEFTKGAAPRTPRPPSSARPDSPSLKPRAFYAIVMHDFEAERADELDAKAGEAITVVAQSNREWFVAKPIGKLGRPGLIPVSFVEIRDPSTGQAVQDVDALIDSGALPRVEEWKKAIMSYKANSISLGVLDESSSPLPTSFASAGNRMTGTPDASINVQAPSPMPQQYTQYQQEPSQQDRSLSSDTLPPGVLLAAEVKSFHFEMDEYWFRVHATYQPYGDGPLPRAKQLVLFRSYNDFYDFQVQLLDHYPVEAGRANQERILPYMPGPVAQVDSQITVARRDELDTYLQQLCDLRFSARYLLECPLLREFLSLKPGDADQDLEPCVAEMEELDKHSVEDQMSRMSLSNGGDSGYAGSNGMDDGYSHDHEHVQPRTSRPSVDYPQRSESTLSAYKKQSLGSAAYAGGPNSRPSSRTSASRTDSYDNGRSYSSLEIDPHRANTYSRSSVASSHDPSPVRSSLAPSTTSGTSGRSRAQSNANNPPISASIPQTAFVKIKIMHERKNDLVAIRVSPRVTFVDLMAKVQTRLGEEVNTLRYRDSMSNEVVELANDSELRSWLDSTDRHLLYA